MSRQKNKLKKRGESGFRAKFRELERSIDLVGKLARRLEDSGWQNWWAPAILLSFPILLLLLAFVVRALR